ncbi:MAG: HNH endonuclease [Pseudomonadota bacterium]|nr:HNH endonuclease [Pseudomonadota bacterium]
MNDRQLKVSALCDGHRTSKEIALMIGDSHKYVQAVMLKFDLPRRKKGSSFGVMNGSYKGGRKIDRDGYVLTSAPLNHPFARHRANRLTGMILEHRLVMENKIGRFLEPQEVVDHIDGLRLHNCPSNLRLFDCNANHLKATITGSVPNWSNQGLSKMHITRGLRPQFQQIDTYRDMKRTGAARLLQILRAALQLGIESPYLLGTTHHLNKAGIFDFSRPNLERALADLYQQYA